jgi:hypothetical protein
MEIRGTCRLVDVFGEWGLHNTEWRVGRTITDHIDAVELVLTYYSSLAWKILRAEPVACFRAEFVPEDIPQIFTYRGRLLDEWATSVEQDTVSRSGVDVRKMVAASPLVVGPLICTCEGEPSGDDVLPRPPFLVFDGWHRGAAWILQGKTGRVYPISARLIVTKRPTRLGRGEA